MIPVFFLCQRRVSLIVSRMAMVPARLEVRGEENFERCVKARLCNSAINPGHVSGSSSSARLLPAYGLASLVLG